MYTPHHELSVQEQYFKSIKDGIKTVEGRAGNIVAEQNIFEIYKENKTHFKAGQMIRFTVSGNENDLADSVICEITKIEFYDSFEEMLTGCGLHNCLPGILSTETGVGVYRGFGGYLEREKLYGVVGIHLQVLQ